MLSWKTGKVIRHNFGRGIFPKDLLEKELKCKKVTLYEKLTQAFGSGVGAKYIIITNYYIFLVVSQPQSKYTCIVLIIYFELQESDLYYIQKIY